MIRRVIRNRGEGGDAPRPIAPPVPGPGGKLDVAACVRYCEAIARAHRHNFPVASIFLPSALRPHVFALYAFARTADDFVEDPAYEGRRGQELDGWEDRLRRLYHGEVDHPVFVAMAETVETCDLPIAPLLDFLSALRLDLTTTRYPTWNDLVSFARLAAGPIGRALLYVFGVRDPARHRYAEELSTALALTGLWQDVAHDLERGRVYIPQEDLKHFGVSEEDLFAHRQTAAITALLRYQCARTRTLLARARPLMDLVDDKLGVEVAMSWYGGERALEILERRVKRGPGGAPPWSWVGGLPGARGIYAGRARFSARDKADVLLHALARRGGSLRARL